MKQMRSRFRLITLLLVCSFLLTVALCTGSALKTAGITLSTISSDVTSIVDTFAAGSSASPETVSEDGTTPAPAETLPEESPLPGADNSPVPEYNQYNTDGL